MEWGYRRSPVAAWGWVAVLAATLVAGAPRNVSAQAAARASVAATSPAAPPALSKHLMPGFAGLRVDDKVLLLPVDVELFSLSAGGVAEPRGDWTQAAQRHMSEAVTERAQRLGLQTQVFDESGADEFGEQVGLHAAVAQSIALHHGVAGAWALPTKSGRLAWSFGDAMQPLQTRTGAHYGLFLWMRDSYASAERKAMMVGMALLGIGITGGVQVGYASLVDLRTGDVVWFNQLGRVQGDLREAGPARESIDVLLTGFPRVR